MCELLIIIPIGVKRKPLKRISQIDWRLIKFVYYIVYKSNKFLNDVHTLKSVIKRSAASTNFKT